MNKLSKEQINDIAQNIDCGQKSFWNSRTFEILTLPDFDTQDASDFEDLYAEDLQKLEKNASDFHEIERPGSSDSFRFMEEFAENLPSKLQLKARLFNALSQRNPFRFFKYEVDNSGPYRQAWFDFKQQKLEEWVEMKFEQIVEELDDAQG